MGAWLLCCVFFVRSFDIDGELGGGNVLLANENVWDVWSVGIKMERERNQRRFLTGGQKEAVHIAVGGIPSGNKREQEEALLSENDVGRRRTDF